jgi:hypothetical protein
MSLGAGGGHLGRRQDLPPSVDAEQAFNEYCRYYARGGDVSVRRGRLLLTAVDVRVGELDSLTDVKEGEGKSSLHIFQVLTREERYYSMKSNARTKIMHNQQRSRKMRLSMTEVTLILAFKPIMTGKLASR